MNGQMGRRNIWKNELYKYISHHINVYQHTAVIGMISSCMEHKCRILEFLYVYKFIQLSQMKYPLFTFPLLIGKYVKGNFDRIDRCDDKGSHSGGARCYYFLRCIQRGKEILQLLLKQH